MGYSCCVEGCTQRFVKGGPYTFHSFPKDENIRKLWEKSIGGQHFVSTKNTRVCSKHFEPRCFLVNEETGRTWLRPDVVPTLFIGSRRKTEKGEPRKEKNKYEKCLARLSSILAEKMERRKERNKSKECSASHPAEQVEPTKEMNIEEWAASNIPSIVYQAQGKRYSYLGDFTEEDMNSPEKAQKVLLMATLLKDENSKTKRKYKHLVKRVGVLEDVLMKMKKTSVISGKVGSVLEGSKTVVEEVKDQSPQEKQDNIPVEPAIRIKEEPVDDYSPPSTSNGTTSEEFILPDLDSPFRTRPVVEPQLTLSVASLNSPNVPEPSGDGPLKKKLRTDSSNIIIASVSTLASVSTVPPNHTAIRPQSLEQNFDISTPGSSKDHPKDQFDSFGDYVANKLTSLDSISSACALNDIQNIILEAEMGKYLNQTQDIKPSIVPVNF